MFATKPEHSLRDSIHESIRDRFRKVAQDPAGQFDYPTGEAGLRGLGYDERLLAVLPAGVARCYCGVGNPFLPGVPADGEDVLDLGSGAGVDACIAARASGTGRVQGLELSLEMLELARSNAALCALGNVSFLAGDCECLPFADASFDLVISNGVFNLIPDKARALAEAHRVLRPGGRLQVADQVRTAEPQGACSLEGGASWAR